VSDNSKAAGRKRGEDLLAHKGIEARARQMLALGFPIVIPTLHTFIRVKGATAIVMDRQPTATAGTHHQTREVCSPDPHRSHSIGAGAVGLQPHLVALILLWGNVGRTAVGQQDQPFSCRHHHAATARSFRLFATRILLPSSVDIGARIEGMFEHGL
jgi:hypothetical protein